MGIRSSRYFGSVSALSALAGGLLLSACASQGPTTTMAPAPAGPDIPPKIRAEEITGRWGLAAFHKADDRAAHRSGRAQPVQAAGM